MIMKVAKLIAVLALTASANTQSEPSNTCAAIITCSSTVGAACGQISSTSYVEVPSANQYCSIGNTVTNFLANGAQCSTTTASCLNYCLSTGVCGNQISNGGACKASTDCQSQNCVSGTCQGANLGQSCSQDANCNVANSYCYLGSNSFSGSGNCTLYSTMGSSCANEQTCGNQLDCVSGKCIAFFTVGAGGVCASSNDCGDGLQCISEKCATPAASSKAACKVDTDCTTSGETCVCNFNAGTGQCLNAGGNPSGSTQFGQNIVSCYNGACASTQTDACAAAHCSGYCSGLKTQFAPIVASENANYPSCAEERQGENIYTLNNNGVSVCNSATTVTASAVAALALAAALVL